MHDLTEDLTQRDLKWLLIVPGGTYLAYRMIRRVYLETQLPPGPRGWPWFGYTRCMGKDVSLMNVGGGFIMPLGLDTYFKGPKKTLVDMLVLVAS